MAKMIKFIFCVFILGVLRPSFQHGVCVWRGLYTNKQFSDISTVSKNSTPFQHRLPRESIRFHRLRAQTIRPLPSFSSPTHLCFWSTGCRLEVPRTPSNAGCQSLVQIVTCTFDWLAINQRFPQPLPWVQLISKTTHINIWDTRWPNGRDA